MAEESKYGSLGIDGIGTLGTSGISSGFFDSPATRSQYENVPTFGPLLPAFDSDGDMQKDSFSTFTDNNLMPSGFDNLLGAAQDGADGYEFNQGLMTGPGISSPFATLPTIGAGDDSSSIYDFNYDADTMGFQQSGLNEEGFFEIQVDRGEDEDPIPLGVGAALPVEAGLGDTSGLQAFDKDQVVAFQFAEGMDTDSPLGQGVSNFLSENFNYDSGQEVNKELLDSLKNANLDNIGDVLNISGEKTFDRTMARQAVALKDKYNISENAFAQIVDDYKTLKSPQAKLDYIRNVEENYRLNNTIANDVYDHEEGTQFQLVSNENMNKFRFELEQAKDVNYKKRISKFGEDEIIFPKRGDIQKMRGQLGYSSQQEYRDTAMRNIGRYAEDRFGSVDAMFSQISAKDFDTIMEILDNPSAALEVISEYNGQTIDRLESTLGSAYTDTVTGTGGGFQKNSMVIGQIGINIILNNAKGNQINKQVRQRNRELYAQDIAADFSVLQNKLTASSLLTNVYDQEISMNMVSDVKNYIATKNAMSLVNMTPAQSLTFANSIQQTVLKGLIPRMKLIQGQVEKLGIASINTPLEMVAEDVQNTFMLLQEEYNANLEAVDSSLKLSRNIMKPDGFNLFQTQIFEQGAGVLRGPDGLPISQGNIKAGITDVLRGLNARMNPTDGTVNPFATTFVPSGLNNTTTPVNTPVTTEGSLSLTDESGNVQFPNTHKEHLKEIRDQYTKNTNSRGSIKREGNATTNTLFREFNERLAIEESRRQEIREAMNVRTDKGKTIYRHSDESRRLQDLYGGLSHNNTTTKPVAGYPIGNISGVNPSIISDINSEINRKRGSSVRK